jgi:hypothetical protein
MVTIRAVLAAVVALSIAVVPAVGGAAIASSSHISMSDDEGMPCNKAMDDSKAIAACALKCFNFAGVVVVVPVLPSAYVVHLERSFITNTFRSHPTRPPFRPPAV